MKVWRLTADIKSLVIILKNNEKDREKVDFNGKSVTSWEAPAVKSTVNKKSKSDLIYFLSGTPVFSERARLILEEEIVDKVQFLPIIHDQPQALFFVNVINVVDCLDYSRSVFRKNPWGRYCGFDRAYFIEEKIQNVHIFKIPEELSSYVFVTDSFKSLVEKAGLKGFDFIEMWDSYLTPEMEEEELRKYREKVAEINASTDKKDWNAAIQLVKEGKAIASDSWKLQLDKHDRIMTGTLTKELDYLWINSAYYPPKFLELNWCETERSGI